MGGQEIFWDKDIVKEQVKAILSDPLHPRFYYFASILLSRTNDSKLVFQEYLDKVIFVKQWNKIKRKMRQNKWNDNRIIYWNEFYVVLREKLNIPISEKSERKTREVIDEQLGIIGEKIQKERKSRKWTQKNLAEKSKLSQQTISLIEGGLVDISFSSLRKIAKALEMKIVFDVKKHKSMRTYPNDFTTTF